MSRRPSQALRHYYAAKRKHQAATYGNSGLHIGGTDQRQFTGGGAPYGEHALSAFADAKREIYFRANFPGKKGRRK